MFLFYYWIDNPIAGTAKVGWYSKENQWGSRCIWSWFIFYESYDILWIVTNLYKVAVRPGKPDEVNISWSLMFGEILSKMQFSSLLIWFAGMADILKHVGNDRPWCVVLTCYQASFKKGQLNSSQWKPHLNSLLLILLNLTKKILLNKILSLNCT